MSFGQALILLKRGQPVGRSAWGGAKLLLKLYYVGSRGAEVLLLVSSTATTIWSAPQADLLAEDWRVIG